MMPQFAVSKKDSLGGLYLENTQLREWQCSDKQVQNLDLWNAPHLTHLDLSQCQAGMHLLLVNCPNLKEVILPTGAPCYLHLDSPIAPSLTIKGSVAVFDACWPGQQFQVEAPKDKFWKGASIAPASWLNTPEKINATDLLVVYGQVEDAEGQQEVKLPKTQHLVWLEAQQLSSLEVTQPSQLEKLDLYKALGLQRIKTNGLLAHAEIRQCDVLKDVHGSLTSLKINGHQGQGSLNLYNAVNYLILQKAKITSLFANQVKRLEINFCRGLTSVVLPDICDVSCLGPVPQLLREVARVFINEATTAELLKEYQQGKEQALIDLLPLINQMVEPVQIPRALKMLNQLLQAGADPDWVWQTRLELSARHLRGWKKKNLSSSLLTEQQLNHALQNWRWILQFDLHEDAWLDDWRIWVACLNKPEAQAYGEVMAKSLKKAEPVGRTLDVPMELHIWLRHWLNAGDLALQPVQNLLKKVLNNLVKERKDKHTPLSAQLIKQLSLQLKMLENDTQSVQLALLDYEYQMLTIKDLLSRMQSLALEDPTLARRHLLHLAAQKPEFWQERGSKAEIANLPRQARAMAIGIGSIGT